MNDSERTMLRDLLTEEFAQHGTTRTVAPGEWVCRCGVAVPTDEYGYPQGRPHIVDRMLDVLHTFGAVSD